jgi:tetratricopeptide (TPR) repeat protein
MDSITEGTACEAPQWRLQALIIGLLLTFAFCLAAKLGPQLEARLNALGEGADDPLATWLGSTRRLFANSFFVKADAYFHSRYYPTIYDNNAPFKTPHIGEDSGTMKSENSGDETAIFNHPNNWVERFELNFFPSRHTHLDQGGADAGDASEVKEILPWLKISAELGSHRIETYLVTAYWLRKRLQMVDEAEEFLRDGLRANPRNAAILFELGQVYRENRHNPSRARNLYVAALSSWRRQNSGNSKPDDFLLGHILGSLALVEAQEGKKSKAIEYLRLLKKVSPDPNAIQARIDTLAANNKPLPNHDLLPSH